MKLGIIVLTNQQQGAAFTAITNTIKDSYLGITGMDRVKQMHDRVVKNEAEAKKITENIWKNIETEQKKTTQPDFNNYAGTYTDKWFGDVVVSMKNGKMWLESTRSHKLTGELFFYKANTYVVKWTDRSLDADAYIQFSLDNTGKGESIKVAAISPLTDFSFDFQDLDLKRTK